MRLCVLKYKLNRRKGNIAIGFRQIKQLHRIDFSTCSIQECKHGGRKHCRNNKIVFNKGLAEV